MAKIWKIAPGDQAREWPETSEQGCITINWMNKTDLSKFKTKEDLKEALKVDSDGERGASSIWHFVHDVQPGDTVVANKGRSNVVGIGKIESGYLPPADPRNPRKAKKEHRHARLVNWVIKSPIELHEQVFTPRIPPTVLPLDAEQCRKIKEAYLKKNPELRDTLDQLFPPETTAVEAPEAKMYALLKQFRQVILYGPPGTGKTREANRAALALLSNEEFDADATPQEVEKKLKQFRDADRFDMVVFHPAYEYEQFVGGIEPTIKEGQLVFHAKAGVFLRLCRAAEMHKQPAVLIIDEINRGNLPKLLGELVYALEYRDHEVRLPFACDGRSDLIVPKNLFIIATMNSADRSIGHIDVAIRRRFGLIPFGPSAEVIQQVWTAAGDAYYGLQLAKLMKRLNNILSANDASADAELGVGHSYFLPAHGSPLKEAKQQVQLKWEYQVKPLLREYAQLLNQTDYQAFLNKSVDQAMVDS